MKKIISLCMALIAILGSLVSCNLANNRTEKESEFFLLVDQTQELLDTVADDIYSYWYDAIYKDKYNESIDLAILTAQIDNADNLDAIETNNTKIKELYKQIPDDSELKSEVKEVMQAYNDYYAFVVEVSGSFKSYSADKETLKKELSSALKNLSFELE